MLIEGAASQQPATEESGKSMGPSVQESVAGVWRKVADPYSDSTSASSSARSLINGGGATKSFGGGLLQASLASLLSKEQRLFLESVKAAIRAVQVDSDREYHQKTYVVLRALRSGGGLGQLLPFLSQYLVEHILMRNPNTPPASIRVAMRAIRALLTNPLVNPAPYLHQLLHALLSLAIGSQSCSPALEEEWLAVRSVAASALAVSSLHSVSRGSHLASLPSLILGAMADVLDTSLDKVSGGQLIGAMEGIIAMGPRAASNLAPRVLRQVLLFLGNSSVVETTGFREDAAEAAYARNCSIINVSANEDGTVVVAPTTCSSDLLAAPVVPFLPRIRALTGANKIANDFDPANSNDKASEADALERFNTAILDLRAECDRREALRSRLAELVLRLVLQSVSPLSLETVGLQGLNTFAVAPALPLPILEHVRTVLAERVALLSHSCSVEAEAAMGKPRVAVEPKKLLEAERFLSPAGSQSLGLKSDDMPATGVSYHKDQNLMQNEGGELNRQLRENKNLRESKEGKLLEAHLRLSTKRGHLISRGRQVESSNDGGGQFCFGKSALGMERSQFQHLAMGSHLIITHI